MRGRTPKSIALMGARGADRRRVAAGVGEWFARASEAWEQGAPRRAFRLFLLGAKAGDLSSQLNLGYFYDLGIGVRQDRQKALQWYRRAYARGDASAATNIGLIYLEQNARQSAIRWFERALKRGDDDSALHLAELSAENCEQRRALTLVRRIIGSKSVTEETRSRAHQLIGKRASTQVETTKRRRPLGDPCGVVPSRRRRDRH